MSSQPAAEFGYSTSSPSGLGAVGVSDCIGCRTSPGSGSTPAPALSSGALLASAAGASCLTLSGQPFGPLPLCLSVGDCTPPHRRLPNPPLTHRSTRARQPLTVEAWSPP